MLLIATIKDSLFEFPLWLLLYLVSTTILGSKDFQHNASLSLYDTVLQVENIFTNSTNATTATFGNALACRISIPAEVFSGLEEAQEVRVASFIYMNISGFLPESLEEDKSDGYVRVS